MKYLTQSIDCYERKLQDFSGHDSSAKPYSRKTRTSFSQHPLYDEFLGIKILFIYRLYSGYTIQLKTYAIKSPIFSQHASWMSSLYKPYVLTDQKCIIGPLGPKNIQRYFRILRARRALQDVSTCFRKIIKFTKVISSSQK